MKLEKFSGQKMDKNQMSEINGGLALAVSNCGTAETNSMGWDKDTDGGGPATDTDKEIEDAK